MSRREIVVFCLQIVFCVLVFSVAHSREPARLNLVFKAALGVPLGAVVAWMTASKTRRSRVLYGLSLGALILIPSAVAYGAYANIGFVISSQGTATALAAAAVVKAILETVRGGYLSSCQATEWFQAWTHPRLSGPTPSPSTWSSSTSA